MIDNDSVVDLVLLDPLGLFVASSSIKFSTVRDLKGVPLWKKRLRSRCILLTSSSAFIMGVTMSGRAFQWDIATVDLLTEHRYPYEPLDPSFSAACGSYQSPFHGLYWAWV